MELIRSTFRRIVTAANYFGTCNICQSPVEYNTSFPVVIVKDEPLYLLVVPVDIMKCPTCQNTIETMQVWKNLDVSKEFKTIQKSIE